MAHARGTRSAWLPLARSTEYMVGDGRKQAAAIDTLSDDIFLEIFAIALNLPYPYTIEHMTEWQRLVQVCKRWRQIIYASPRYLNLHLCCSNGTSIRKILSCWPALPISIAYHLPFPDEDDGRSVELIAALEHPDRIHRVELDTMSGVEQVAAVMQVPFPVIKHLEISVTATATALPSGFLGGSAPCLQHLRLDYMPFPELPALLLSARDLVSLQLSGIPPTGAGYISPQAMGVCLAGLPRLETLYIGIQYPIPPSEQTTRRPDPPVIAVLPALTHFMFRGESKYLEGLVVQIDTPRVKYISVGYLMEDVQASQFSQFIGRAENLKLAQFKNAEVTFSRDDVSFKLIEDDDEHKPKHERSRVSVTIEGGRPES
jgi:hypothetical protein